MTGENAGIMESNRVSLRVGGVLYGGWKSVHIMHAIDQLAGVFSLSVSDVWPERATRWAIGAGDACEVLFGQDAMITGYVDTVRVSQTPNDHTITVEGRDKSGDLVDCSPEAREWDGMSLDAVISDLIRPFGMSVRSEVGKIQMQSIRLGVTAGDTVHGILDRVARMHGVLLISDRKGGLVITRAGKSGRATEALSFGGNMKSIDYTRSFSGLFSEITVKGQSHGAANLSGASMMSAASRVKPMAKMSRSPKALTGNSGVGRYRPLVVEAEGQATPHQCAERATWEVAARQARSERVEVYVQGWRQGGVGPFWRVNTLARLVCPSIRSDSDMLIASADFSLDMEGGTQTTLTLVRPESFSVLAEIPAPQPGLSAQDRPSATSRLSGAQR